MSFCALEMHRPLARAAPPTMSSLRSIHRSEQRISTDGSVSQYVAARAQRPVPSSRLVCGDGGGEGEPFGGRGQSRGPFQRPPSPRPPRDPNFGLLFRGFSPPPQPQPHQDYTELNATSSYLEGLDYRSVPGRRHKTSGLTYQDRTQNASAEIVSQAQQDGEVSTSLGRQFNDRENYLEEVWEPHAPLDPLAQQSYEYPSLGMESSYSAKGSSNSSISKNLMSGDFDTCGTLSSVASERSLQERTDCTRAVTVSDLIKYQDYRGAFSLGGDFASTRAVVMARFSSLSTAQLCEIVEAKPSFLKSVIEGRSDHRLFDTLIAIAYIRTQFPESRELWELVIQKAEIYVDQFFRDKKDWEQVTTWLQEMQEAPQVERPAIKGDVVKNDMPRNNSFADPNRFPCPDTKCNITFDSESNATRHFRMIPGHQLRCPVSRCNKGFQGKDYHYDLSWHIQMHHLEQAGGLSDSAKKEQDCRLRSYWLTLFPDRTTDPITDLVVI